MLNFKLIAVAALLSSGFPACASEPELSSRYSSCLDRAGGVTISMIDCIRAELALQDVKLNANYKLLGVNLSSFRKKQLVDAQRAWLSFRDANCAFYADPDGGTLATVMAQDCLLNMTASRANELSRLSQ